MADSSQDKLSKLAAHWNKIEARLKEAEQFREESVTAAINEMRYAGRRIIDVLQELETTGWAQSDKVDEDLIVAKNYLINADHDITDGICFFAHRRLRRVLEHHGRAKVERYCSDFVSLFPDIIKAQEIIRGSREDRTSRMNEYENLATNYLPIIMELHNNIRETYELHLPDDIPSRLDILQRYVRSVGWLRFWGRLPV